MARGATGVRRPAVRFKGEREARIMPAAVEAISRLLGTIGLWAAERIGRDDGLFGVEMKSKRTNPCPDGYPKKVTKHAITPELSPSDVVDQSNCRNPLSSSDLAASFRIFYHLFRWFKLN